MNIKMNGILPNRVIRWGKVTRPERSQAADYRRRLRTTCGVLRRVMPLLVLGVIALPGWAQFITDRSVFDALAPSSVTETFEGLIGTPQFPNNFVGNGYKTQSPEGIVVSGVRYVGYTVGWNNETYIFGPGENGIYSVNGSDAMCLGKTAGDVHLPANVTAFGADVGLRGAHEDELPITVFLRDGRSETTRLKITQRSQFFGYVGSEIERIHFESGQPFPYPETLLDNVTIGSAGSGTKPVILTPPRDQSALAGTDIALEVKALGEVPLDYQWQFNGTNLQDDGRISGVRSDTLQISAVAAADAGTYTVVVSNAYGSVTSSPATLTVLLRPPEIVAEPAIQTVVSGAPATFAVTATGSLPMTFQWRRNGVDLTDGERVSGVQTPTLSIAAAGLEDLGIYTVMIRNAYGTVTSTPATLTVTLQPPDITSDPVDQSVFSGADATFSVSAVGSLPLSYQWQRNGIALTDGGRISGSQTATLRIKAAEVQDLGLYLVEVRNAYGWTVSFPAQLAVALAPPTITVEPVGQTVALGATVRLQAQATGSLPLSYQWRRDGVEVADGGRFNGAATSTLTLSELSLAELGNYSVVVENSRGRVQSKSVSVATFTVVLQIQRDGDEVRLSWNDTGDQYVLQRTSTLATSGWVDVVESLGTNHVKLLMTNTTEYFRLFRTLPAGLVAWWSGDGHANDCVGTNHGTLMNGATFVPGKVGQAFGFDGQDDYVMMDNSPDLQMGRSDYAITAWIKTDTPGDSRVYSHGSSCGSTGYMMRLGGDRVHLENCRNGSGLVFFDGNTTVTDDAWHFIAGVVDRHLGARIYIDGSPDGTQVIDTSAYDLSNSVNPTIGANTDCCGGPVCEFFQGAIDEVQIFNRALSADEIKAMYEAGMADAPR